MTRHITDNNTIKTTMLDKRTKVMNAGMAMLSDVERKRQKTEIANTLEIRGLYLETESRLSTPPERDYFFAWIAKELGADYERWTKTHSNPKDNQNRASPCTRIVFENVNQMREFKRFINVANSSGAGIPIWDIQKSKPFETSKIFWVEIFTEAERLQALTLKACMTCLRKEKAFYDVKDKCSLREITNEGKSSKNLKGTS